MPSTGSGPEGILAYVEGPVTENAPPGAIF